MKFSGIVPYLFYDDAGLAMDWYARHFGFEERERWTDDEGNVQNGEMRVGDTEVWLDGSGRRQDSDPRPHWIGVWVDDVEAMHAQLRARGLACDPPADRDFGVRMLNVEDEFGFLWGFIQRLPG
ncbi:MAG: VOC family protein [Halioglobus sp.]|nr:VOC family protein [Halioglobus sp.]